MPSSIQYFDNFKCNSKKVKIYIYEPYTLDPIYCLDQARVRFSQGQANELEDHHRSVPRIVLRNVLKIDLKIGMRIVVRHCLRLFVNF